MTRKALIVASVALLLSGCATPMRVPRPRGGASVVVEEEEAWRGVATDEDAAAIDRLPQLWAEALGEARRLGFPGRVAAEGALLEPAAGLPRAAPPPGAYLCRMVRLGTRAKGARPWSEGGRGFCFVGVEHDQLSLTVDAGPRRIGGYLWEEKQSGRLVFLGATGARGVPLGAYGDAAAGNVAGLFERIGPFRYRLTLPWRGDNKLALVELSPAPGQ